MQEQDLIASWKREAQQPFSGWDFSYLKGRYWEAPPPWSYEERVRALLVEADAVLDMGTGGVFVTQQVDGRGPAGLCSVFGMEPPYPHVTLAACGKEVEQAGLVLEFAAESTGQMRFGDVGALVYFARAAPWEFPADFSVERYAPQLLELHNSGRLSFTMGHFIIQARKPS